MSEQAAEALRRVTPGEWVLLIKVLTRYAVNRSRRLGWRTETSDELPGGETPASVVSKAITMVLRGASEERPDEQEGVRAGVRRWEPRKDPDLKKYLMDVVKSILNHLAESEDNALFQRPPAGEEARAWEERLNRPAADRAWLARGGETPEEILLRQEAARFRERALRMLQDEVRGDAVLSRVVESMLAGHREAADIAEDTGLPVKQVYNAGKRLDRKAAAVRLKLRQTGHAPKER